jgi:hypothetical protein
MFINLQNVQGRLISEPLIVAASRPVSHHIKTSIIFVFFGLLIHLLSILTVANCGR